MPRSKKSDMSSEIMNLLIGTEVLLKKKKKELNVKRCKKCDSARVHAASLCKERFYAERKAREEIRRGKVWVTTDGYKRTYDENDKPVLYHRHVVEQFLGRKLSRNERVGFKDGDKTNCELSNLTFEGPVDLSLLVCPNCGENFIKDPEHTSQHPTKIHLPTQLDL